MENKFKRALIVAYYLSKFDLKAAKNLGYKSRTEAFREIGNKINVNHFTIKQMRDQFDTLHGHRRGYHQFPLPPSRVEVAEKYKSLSEIGLNEIVKDIINDSSENYQNLDTYVDILDTSDEKDREKIKGSNKYTTRGITGVLAEEIFKNDFSEGKIKGFSGELIDNRQKGSGYDFKSTGNPEYFFEVKGLAIEKGGIMFTDKEWAVAQEKREQYILVFIRNINEEPNIQLISDPFGKLKPNKNIVKTITVNWAIDASQLRI